MTVLGEKEYFKLKKQGKPIIILVWHGRILLAPYFFRRRGVMPLISPSKDGEIIAQVLHNWGYKILRGSGSHAIIKAWNKMKKELQDGGELIIVPDGPKGPSRKMKLGGVKLAQETGAYLVPFTFSASRGKFFNSWDRFLIFYPFSKVVAAYGQPLTVNSILKPGGLEKERLRIENTMLLLERETDQYIE
ncbi:lysophospholipid acyltransferase family protein [Acidobacteriota bacterium]